MFCPGQHFEVITQSYLIYYVAFDRLVAAYQAYPSLKARFSKPGTFSHTFTEIMNEGLIQGAFKGFIYNFAQFGLVLYPSVYLANKNGDENKYFSFLATYTFLDTLFYPLDTLKNILYADTLGHYCNNYLMQL